jgi:formamidopyrimidine-DNA glycosylase
MPELPEVETVAAALRRLLVGRRLTGLRVRWRGALVDRPIDVRRALLGRTLVGVGRHGKYLLFCFGPSRERSGPDRHLMAHLRMTGQFVLAGARPLDRHVHLSLDFDGLVVHYRDVRKFGRLALVDDPQHPSALGHVGPDMLEVDFATWHDRAGSRGAPIKSVLLDQGVAAGLGNIYADEALHRAGIHPLTPARDLPEPDLRRIFREARRVLRQAVRQGGTTFLSFADTENQPGRFRRRLRVYGRTGEPCPACGTEVERLVVGGRATHFCPRCQPPLVAGGRLTAASRRRYGSRSRSRGR